MTRIEALLVAVLAAGCQSPTQTSDARNPLGWPARALQVPGRAAADSEVPLLREVGRLLYAAGDLVDAPALAVEGLVTLDVDRAVAAGEHALVGTGSTITAAFNVPFFVVPGRTVGLGPYAAQVNAALIALESAPPELFRADEQDRRTFVFPHGTRARASGRDLIYTVPGYGEVLQSARSNVLWDLWNRALGTNFVQERSWGFVVRDAGPWNEPPTPFRTKIVLHEFYHQHMQMRVWMRGWTLVYWPAYMAVYPFTGWYDHWAEGKGRRGAGAVDRGLAPWVVGVDPRGPAESP